MKIAPKNVKVMYDSVLVRIQRPIKENQKVEDYVKNEAGIFIPVEKKNPMESDQENPFVVGEAVCIGNGYISQDNKGFIKLSISIGDSVVFDRRNNANNIVFEDEDDVTVEYRLVRESNILMVINGCKKELSEGEC